MCFSGFFNKIVWECQIEKNSLPILTTRNVFFTMAIFVLASQIYSPKSVLFAGSIVRILVLLDRNMSSLKIIVDFLTHLNLGLVLAR